MSDPTPDPRATLELVTRLDAEMTPGLWQRFDTGTQFGIASGELPVSRRYIHSGDAAKRICYANAAGVNEANLEGIAALRNALPSIIRDLRRLAEVEAELPACRHRWALQSADWNIELNNAESDRDAGWQAADALAGALGIAKDWMPRCTCCFGGECRLCKTAEALAAYTAARAKRGDTNPNPEGRT